MMVGRECQSAESTSHVGVSTVMKWVWKGWFATSELWSKKTVRGSEPERSGTHEERRGSKDESF
jgi:hypothetical protein